MSFQDDCDEPADGALVVTMTTDGPNPERVALFESLPPARTAAWLALHDAEQKEPKP